MKNANTHHLLTTITLFWVAASSCSKKEPSPPVACYRKDGGACQFSKMDGSSADFHISSDGPKSENNFGVDGTGGQTDTQSLSARDSLEGDARPVINNNNNDATTRPADAFGVDGFAGRADIVVVGGAMETGGAAGSTDGGTPDASAVDAPIDAPVDAPRIVDGLTAGRDVVAESRPADTERDVREAGSDISLDLPAFQDGALHESDVMDHDTPGPSVDSPVNPDVALDTPTHTPVQDAGESSDSESQTTSGTCPVVSKAHQYDVTSLGVLALDGEGIPYIAAKLFDTADFGAGALTSAGRADLMIAKLNPTTLTATWSKSFSGTGENNTSTDQIPVGLAVSQSGQVGVIGTFEGNMVVNSTTTLSGGGGGPIDFIMATDNSGNALWGKTVDTQSGSLQSIASHPARNEFVVCGYALGPVTALGLGGTYGDDPDNPLEDILIAKLNPATGAVIWARQIGGVGSQLCKSVAMDSAGTVYASGTYNGTLDFGNGALPSIGSTTVAIWVAKLDSADGHALVVKKYGTFGKPVPRGLAVDNNGNVAITGNLRHSLVFGDTTIKSSGGTDGFLAKLDTNLDPLWARNWGDTADQDASRVAFTSTGNLFVVGYMNGSVNLAGATLTSAGLVDAYWAEFSPTGESLCAAVYGDGERDQVASALAIHGEQVVVAGFSSGAITFAPGLTLTSTTPKGFLFVLP